MLTEGSGPCAAFDCTSVEEGPGLALASLTLAARALCGSCHRRTLTPARHGSVYTPRDPEASGSWLRRAHLGRELPEGAPALLDDLDPELDRYIATLTLIPDRAALGVQRISGA